ncbi:MAG: Gfo/Idh/MocA family oxidoreductase [Armatimonadetes bacterium]|nr:Gfo/Idh/MocA family oxidoreductase [Armatimonadota bacterium]
MAAKIGILGAGFIGRVHALNLRKDSRVELAGIADVVPEAAARLAGEVGARPFQSLAQLLDAGVRAIYVTTPNATHVEPVVMALGAGVHVFSEKPMATNLAGAGQIRDAARKSKALCQIGFNRRFANVYKFAKRLIADGTVVPKVAHMKMNRGELKQPPWTSDTAVTGGFLYETPVHLFDMMRHLMGEVAEVTGWAVRSVYNEPDGFALLVRFRSGVIATFATVAHTTWLFPFERVEIYGEHQAVVTEEMERAFFSSGIRAEVQAIDCAQMPFEEKWGYVEEDRLFIDAVLGERGPAVTAEDGYRATQLVEAVYRCVREGNPVTLPLKDPAPR